MDLQSILVKAKDGTVSDAEFQYVRQIVQSRDIEKGDLYTALHVLGLTTGPESEDLVRPYLGFSHDRMVARLALQILYGYWGIYERSAHDAQRFLAGVDWDADGDVRQMAVELSVPLLREAATSKVTAGLLLRVAEDEAESPVLRADAIRALAGGLWYPRADLPRSGGKPKPDSKWSLEVLERAKRKFK